MGYYPNKAIFPGKILARSLEREGMTQKNLSERTGLSEKHLSQIINGEAPITVETALLLENALGGSASFWINLEKNFQETKARIERTLNLKKEAPLVKAFPYSELVRLGFVEQTSNIDKKVENLWKFFGVNSLLSVQETESMAFAVAYRKRSSSKIKKEAIAAWLRCGELLSKKDKLPNYSESGLKQSLDKVKNLTTLEPKDFSSKAQEMLSENGVSLVYLPHFAGTGVSGAVRWLNDTPLIQLSLFGTYADMFWFNLFHELGHLLLHGKKDEFIIFEKGKGLLPGNEDKEKEADEFASKELLPAKEYEEFLKKGDISKTAVSQFALSINRDPGIVEGRLCHDKLVKWNKPLGFRKQLRFAP